MKKALALLVLLAALLTGCAQEEKPAYKPAATSEPLVLTAVSTPYGELYYQSKWDGVMVTRQEQEEMCLRVDFSAKLEEKMYPLFQVTIGMGRGSLVGKLTDGEGTTREVYISAQSVDEPEIPQEEQTQLYAMQEEINILIQNLK